MTAARRKRKRFNAGCVAAAGVLLLASAVCALQWPRPPNGLWWAGTARLLLAASPVAFFTKDRALSDSPDFEFRYTGAIWRFHHMGNRAAFATQPEIYMPQFGGYDPMGVIRGIAVAGNPNVWPIAGRRLYRFYDRTRMERFAADADCLAAEAECK